MKFDLTFAQVELVKLTWLDKILIVNQIACLVLSFD